MGLLVFRNNDQRDKNEYYKVIFSFIKFVLRILLMKKDGKNLKIYSLENLINYLLYQKPQWLVNHFQQVFQ